MYLYDWYKTLRPPFSKWRSQCLILCFLGVIAEVVPDDILPLGVKATNFYISSIDKPE